MIATRAARQGLCSHARVLRRTEPRVQSSARRVGCQLECSTRARGTVGLPFTPRAALTATRRAHAGTRGSSGIAHTRDCIGLVALLGLQACVMFT